MITLAVVVVALGLGAVSCWLEERAGLGWVVPAGVALFLAGLAI